MVEGRQSSAEINDRPSRPENCRQASDQLAGYSSIDRDRQKPEREDQTVSGATIGTGLQEIKGHFHLMPMPGAWTARLSCGHSETGQTNRLPCEPRRSRTQRAFLKPRDSTAVPSAPIFRNARSVPSQTCFRLQFAVCISSVKTMSFNQMKRQETQSRMAAVRKARRGPKAAAALQHRASLVGDGAKWRITNLNQVARAIARWA